MRISLSNRVRHCHGIKNSLNSYRRYKPTRDVGGTLENHKPEASDLQAFRVFFQHPAWVYNAGKLVEKGVLLLLGNNYEKRL